MPFGAGGAAAVAAGMATLFDSTLGANAASIDTGANGIAQTSQHLLVTIITRTTQAVTQSTVIVRFNGDAGANYDNCVIQTVNATPGGGTGLAATGLTWTTCGASCEAGAAGCLRLLIPAYTQTTFHKVGHEQEGVHNSLAADNISGARSFRYKATAAINQLSVAAGSGNLLAGSRVTVLGLG